jgi:CDP-6-deoxy-D-xylo-4-hexulose-3-dehydrase
MLPLITHTWDDEEKNAIKLLLQNNNLTMGEKVKLFEHQFSSMIGSKYAIMVNSGSSANLLAIASLFYCENPLKPGDEVIVPAVSWATTYSPLQQYNLKLKFVDIDLDTINIDLVKMKNAISPQTKLIVAVNVAGNPVDYVKMLKIINDENVNRTPENAIRLIEDNCESLGATFNEKQAGTFGILGTFSTYFSHHISTIEGGIVVTDNKELYHILLSIRSHGWTRHLPIDTKICEKHEDEFYNLFNFILPGYNVRPTDITGVVGLEQLKKLKTIIDGRRENAKIFKKLFNNLPNLKIQQETGQSSWFGFIIILPSIEIRALFIKLLQKNKIEYRPVIAGNFCKNTTIKYYNYSIHENLDNSDIIHERGIYIGNHSLNISDQLYLVRDLLMTLL